MTTDIIVGIAGDVLTNGTTTGALYAFMAVGFSLYTTSAVISTSHMAVSWSSPLTRTRQHSNWDIHWLASHSPSPSPSRSVSGVAGTYTPRFVNGAGRTRRSSLGVLLYSSY
jgi:hypothetical protein